MTEKSDGGDWDDGWEEKERRLRNGAPRPAGPLSRFRVQVGIAGSHSS